MNSLAYMNLESEIHALEKMIAEAPKSAIIGRMSLEARLQSVREELDAMPSTPQSIICGTLSFRGKPVLGTRGIDAVFGMKAVESFEKIIAIRAASFTLPISNAGRIPNREQCNLVITGTTRGSFGFELENRIITDEFDECQDASSYLEDAVNKTIDFFESVCGTDEELAESILDVDERSVKEIGDFLTFLTENEAVCALEFGNRSFYFKDISEVSNCAKRLRLDNIHERCETISGVFLGILPKKRQFEFLTTPQNEILSGRIGADIDEPETINTCLKQPVSIRVHVTQIGTSKPKYRLFSFSRESQDGQVIGVKPDTPRSAPSIR